MSAPVLLRVCVAVIASATLFPAALAGVDVDAGLVNVVVSDAYSPDSCTLPAPEGVCVASYTTGDDSSLGDDRIDLYQNYRAVMITVRLAGMPIAGPATSPLLPDDSITVRTSDLTMSQPAVRAYATTRDVIVAPLPTPLPADVQADRSNLTIVHPGGEPVVVPWDDDNSTFNYTSARAPKWFKVGHSDAIEEAAFESPCESTVNDTVLQTAKLLCNALGLGPMGDTLSSALPDVNTGAQIDEVNVTPQEAPHPEKSLSRFNDNAPFAFLSESAQPDVFALPHDEAPPPPLARDPVPPAPHGLEATPFRATRGAVATAALAATDQPPASVGWRFLAAGIVTGFALLAVPIWALYRRISRRDVLTQATRAQLLTIVHHQPGIAMSQLARQLGVHRRAADYHCDLLMRAGALAIDRRAASVRAYPVGMRPRSDTDARIEDAALHAVAREIVLAVGRNGPTPRHVIYAQVREPKSTIDWHLTRLEHTGLLQRLARGVFTLDPATRERTLDRALGFQPAPAPAAAPS